MLRRLFVGLCALILVGVAALYLVIFPPIQATHPAVAQASLPDLIPLREFYAERRSSWRFRLSPDGKRMAWLATSGFRPALFVRDLDGSDAEVFKTKDEVRWYTWSADGRYLLYQADRDGWENDQIVSFDVSNPDAEPRTYDFGKGAKSWIEFIPPEGGAGIIVAHNAREPSLFDLYRLNLDTGETELLHKQAPNRTQRWAFDRSGNLYARTIRDLDMTWSVEVKMGGRWRNVVRGGMEDNFYFWDVPDEDGNILAVSNLKRDKSALVRRNVLTGQEDVLLAHDRVDMGGIITNPATRDLVMVTTADGRQQRHFFDPEVEALVSRIDMPDDANLYFTSATRDFSKSIWEVEDDQTGWTTYLVDRDADEVTLIKEAVIKARADDLVPLEPVNIQAQDGLTIPAYLTRPKGAEGPAPMVVLIHGGPVARTYWGFDSFAQMLSNRGYATLNVNYRGGSGYGRAFREAAVGEISRKMHQDIVDARAWAVAEGIADPDKVAVMGGSFGGLKTLTAMTESPELFAAGVNINGISDISTLEEEKPPYWNSYGAWYRKYIGRISKPDELAEIKARSPLYNVDRITGPILIIQGSNDVRVIKSQADRMVKAMQEAGKDVRYELIEGAGHTSANMGWKQRLAMYRKIERFLAQELGGRADGFDYAVLGAMVLPK